MSHSSSYPTCTQRRLRKARHALPILAALAVPAIGLATPPSPVAGEAGAAAGAGDAFEQGAHCLFIGHSFFVPVAEAFDAVAAGNGFPLHEMDAVFRGGPAGSPQAMWENVATRAEVEALLATGEIELFGLTSFTPETSDFQDYAQWFDLALQYNPQTHFFVGVPWGPSGPSLETEVFDQMNEEATLLAFEVVAELRTAYPDHRIDLLGYGKTASVMKGRFEAGQLPDIVQLVGSGPDALFSDGFIGHGGPMMLELSSLSWMDVLYGATVETLQITPYQSDVAAIVGEVLAFNAPFQQPVAVPGDVDGDGVVGFDDILAVIAAWGPCPGQPAECPADVDASGVVGFDDILVVVANWG